MKKIIFALILALPIISKAQAHLGESLSELKERYPDNDFKIEYTNNGTRFAMTDQLLGTFVYYFENETGLTNLCVQFPYDMTKLNTLVEVYNEKYVIISETSWKAYVEDGGIIKITLVYEESLKNYVFYYTN